MAQSEKLTKHFIKNIEIKKFKCFENFKAEGFSRVNLITGKNDVGKTAFLEAAYINISAITLPIFTSELRGIKFRRESINILYGDKKVDSSLYLEQRDGFNVISDVNTTAFSVKRDEGVKEYIFNFNKQEVRVNSNDFSLSGKDSENNFFIDNFGISNSEITHAFSKMQESDQEHLLNEELVKFDANITDFKIINSKPKCKINGEYLELTELGDGTQHLISIVTLLFQCRGGCLFIDEMDNGIHYSKLDELWEVILKTSKKLNVQVFATTHSKECIESYARVAKKLQDAEIALIELGKKDKNIDSIVFDYKGIIHHREQKLEVRGW